MNSSAFFGRSVIVHPEAAGGELVETQHVHDADGGQTGAEQVRPLRHGGADEQTAVAAALDGELVRPRVLVVDEPLRRGDEIVEDVLLAQLGAGLVPLLAVLAAAAQIGLRVHAAQLQPSDTRMIEKPGVSGILKPP